MHMFSIDAVLAILLLFTAYSLIHCNASLVPNIQGQYYISSDEAQPVFWSMLELAQVAKIKRDPTKPIAQI